MSYDVDNEDEEDGLKKSYQSIDHPIKISSKINVMKSINGEDLSYLRKSCEVIDVDEDGYGDVEDSMMLDFYEVNTKPNVYPNVTRHTSKSQKGKELNVSPQKLVSQRQSLPSSSGKKSLSSSSKIRTTKYGEPRPSKLYSIDKIKIETSSKDFSYSHEKHQHIVRSAGKIYILL